MQKPLLILVGGGSASGKSTVVSEVLEAAGLNDVAIIRHDDYYLDQKDVPLEKRYELNYDHPRSFDNELLFEDLQKLLNYEAIDRPVYDFEAFTRSNKIVHVEPKKVIIIEGILILENKKIRDLADIKIYVEADDDTRLIRRILRDMKERGRSIESIIQQYETTVKPMYHKYIKPTKRYADVIIPNDQKHDIAVDLIVVKIKTILGGHQ